MSKSVFARTLGEPTPQSEPTRPDQVQNNAGGFVFTISPKARLERFLILGTDGGTYYVNEKKLTKDNVDFLIQLIQTDEQLVIDTVRDVSTNGRAYRNSPAIFAVAALFRYGNIKPKSLVEDVCRTATHLFEFAEYVQLLGGWSRSTRSAVSQWYLGKSEYSLAMQVVKYRQRNGWTHQDLLRLAHPKGLNTELGNFILGKDQDVTIPLLRGFKAAQSLDSDAGLLAAIMRDWPNLPWEAYPTSVHKQVEFWKTLFYNGALRGQALVRNVTRLTRLRAFNDMVFARDYATKLTDDEMIKGTMLHPIQYLLALVTHTKGQVDRKNNAGGWYGATRNKDWNTSSVITDALNAGFYMAFHYVEPANKRTLIGLDVSGSMSSLAMGIDLSCAEVGAAMAMTIARTEPYHATYGFANDFRDLGISPSMQLDDILNKTAAMNFGSTDCSLPMIYALKHNIAVDTFIVITDSETWAGRKHPHIALEEYRQKTGIPARQVVVGLTGTEFTIADPKDRGTLDVVGGDTNLPRLIAEFSAGRI